MLAKVRDAQRQVAGRGAGGSKVLSTAGSRMLRPWWPLVSGYWGKNNLNFHGKEETCVSLSFAVKDPAKRFLGTGIDFKNPERLWGCKRLFPSRLSGGR